MSTIVKSICQHCGRFTVVPSETIAALLAAEQEAGTPAPPSNLVGIAPLKWECVVGDVEVAGSYKIDRMRPWTGGKPKKYWVQIALGFGFKTVATMCGTLEDAKAAAQSDYAARIRAALSSAPEVSE